MKHKIALFFCSFLFLALFFVSSSCSLVSTYSIDVYVDKIIDGDTFCSNDQKYRILGIDTPEVYDSNNNFLPTQGIQYFYGKLASQQANLLLNNKVVEIEESTKDIYDRHIVKVTLNNNLDFASYMVENGYARVAYISDNEYNPFYYYDTNYVHKLQSLELEAQKSQKGFWKENSSNINKIFPNK